MYNMDISETTAFNQHFGFLKHYWASTSTLIALEQPKANIG